jgi:hypothetical protein
LGKQVPQLQEREENQKLREAEWKKDVLAKRTQVDDEVLMDAEKYNNADAVRKRREAEEFGKQNGKSSFSLLSLF